MGPGSRGSRDRIEAEGGCETTADAIMVTAHVELGSGTDQVNDFIGAGAIADYVTEVPQNIEWSSRFEDGVECFEVSVDVGENQGAH